ncbi:DegT/DnrJ/EryC1/StrS aminotransferase family protein [Chitinibacter sp. ZOR0017]|uniref:DegT/DnrJ/EryC1/StrS family aminotransferase n=1 Tax=Chitinibacter sp. ZOR0017 TaxID=1339254 RepID=UPI0006472DA7|nr:DegT/DnrJ/EryC1/StrS aminotransferase family protein [Chitinibacter sp. ZOR0017]
MLNTKLAPWPSFSDAEIMAVTEVLKSGKVNYWTGSESRLFEKEFSAWCEAKYAVALSNGTLALDVALKALGIGPGDDVIVTSRTFLASASCIVTAGANPIFADVDLNSQNITAESIAAVLTDNTKAIICVHLAGWPCEMDDILALVREKSIFIIEDCAQAHGAKYKGRPVGSIGDVAAWSFCQDKIMSTGGEGGMVTTNNEQLWRKMWSYKDHGKSWDAVYDRQHPPGFRWLHDTFGTNWRMMEIQAVIGRIQLQCMQEWTQKRQLNAAKIDQVAKRFACIRLPEIPAYIEHAQYKHYLFVEPTKLKDGWTRDRIIDSLATLGIPCYQGSCSEVYLEKAFDGTPWRPAKRLPNAQNLGDTSLMFLVHPTLTDADMKSVCDALELVLQQASI